MGYTKRKRIIKRFAAAVLSVTMAFGVLMLPGNNDYTKCEAAVGTYRYDANDCTFFYYIEYSDEGQKLILTDVTKHGDTVEVPSVIEFLGTEYPVTTIGDGFLVNDKTVKTVIFPDSVKFIDSSLYYSSVEKIVLPDDLEELGDGFAAECPNLQTVEYNGVGIKKGRMGARVFNNSNPDGIKNDKGAICLGNWLIKYLPDDSTTSVKVADLGNDGIKIEHVADYAVNKKPNLTTVDLEMIQTIGDYNFYNCENLKNITNGNSVRRIGLHSFERTPWYDDSLKDGLVRIGNTLMYYKTDSDTIDVTSGDLEGIVHIEREAFRDCENAEIFKADVLCDPDINLFYVAHEQNGENEYRTDGRPFKPTYKIKTVILNGKELTYENIINDSEIYKWFGKYFFSLNRTVFMENLLDAKTKELFRQLDIPYWWGMDPKTVTYTPTEEFYIRLKIHNYISLYDYDHKGEYACGMDAFMRNGKCICGGYAQLSFYLLECAGMEGQYLGTSAAAGGNHAWNNTRIGDEWFENDDGWNAQNNNHSYSWFGQSTARISERDPINHTCGAAFDSFHYILDGDRKSELQYAERTIGDADGDNDRDKDDAVLMWSYMKGETDTIDKKGADVNFDGKIDITDAVLLDQFVNSKALDRDKVPTDGFAPSVKVAFVNGTDYDNIQYVWTDREGYIKLPELDFEAPEGKKLSYDIGRVGQEVRITNPLTVVQVKWIDENEEDSSSKPDSSSEPDKKNGILGDVNNDGNIDIEDAVAIIQHINGVTPLTADEETRADVSKDTNIDIDDAVVLISYINGNSTF